MLSLADLPVSAFPAEPLESGECLKCGAMYHAKRRRHSWFCREECEEAFLRDYETANAEGNLIPEY